MIVGGFDTGLQLATLNRFNREVIELASSSALLPLGYTRGTMWDAYFDTRRRKGAAKAAPCMHQRRSTTSVDLTASKVTHKKCRWITFHLSELNSLSDTITSS